MADVSSPLHGMGLRRCPPARIAFRTHARALAVGATPKGAATIALPPPLDQGQTSTCFAHSLAMGIYGALKGSFLPSPKEIAACTYALARSRATPMWMPLPSLLDVGADLQQCADVLTSIGIAPMTGPTSDGRNSDVENDPPDNVFPEPSLSRIERTTRVDGEYVIPVDDAAPTLAALCLDARIPVQVGFFCDHAFQALVPGSIAPIPDTSDPNGGGHAVLLRGYSTDSEGLLEFHVRNSWGSNWCDGGDCAVSAAWVSAAWELFPVAVSLPSANRVAA